MDPNKALRDELVALLRGGNAHMSFDEAVEDFPQESINEPMPGSSRPPGVPLTPWHLLEHMRLAQRDILGFIVDPKHVSPEYPARLLAATRRQGGQEKVGKCDQILPGGPEGAGGDRQGSQKRSSFRNPARQGLHPGPGDPPGRGSQQLSPWTIRAF
jgi:hypothetical protein